MKSETNRFGAAASLPEPEMQMMRQFLYKKPEAMLPCFIAGIERALARRRRELRGGNRLRRFADNLRLCPDFFI
jgi:hypothetical protein